MFKKLKDLIDKKTELTYKQKLNELEERLEQERRKEKKREFEKHFDSLFSYSLEKAVKKDVM